MSAHLGGCVRSAHFEPWGFLGDRHLPLTSASRPIAPDWKTTPALPDP
jgi:hypothetical protein